MHSLRDVDGHQRVEFLRELGHDTVKVLVWEMEASEALVLGWQMAQGPVPSALEQGWLLAELRRRFGWSQEELAQRFLRSASWVSRRLGLVEDLPLSIQESIREGQIPAQAGMRALVPLARLDREACQRLAEQIVEHKLTSPEIQTLYSIWLDAGQDGRRRLIEDPRGFLRAREKLKERKRSLASQSDSFTALSAWHTKPATSTARSVSRVTSRSIPISTRCHLTGRAVASRFARPTTRSRSRRNPRRPR